MSVHNTNSPLNGPEGQPRRTPGPDLKQCEHCGRLGTRLYQPTPTGHRCTARTACTDRRLAR